MLRPEIDLPLISPRTTGFVVTAILYMWFHAAFFSLTFLVLCFFFISLFLNPDGDSVVLCSDITLPQKLVDSTEFVRCIYPILTFCIIKYIVN